MPARIVTDGLDPLTRPALDYLVSEYGIDPAHINKIVLTSLYGDVQMITVTLLVQQAAKTPSPLRQVPLLRVPMRDERPSATTCAKCQGDHHEDNHDEETTGPTGDGATDLKAAAARLNQAHEPKTTCVYMVDYPGGRRPCGEVIRRERSRIDVSSPAGVDSTMPGPWEWVHVSDERLGTSAHPATPGY